MCLEWFCIWPDGIHLHKIWVKLIESYYSIQCQKQRKQKWHWNAQQLKTYGSGAFAPHQKSISVNKDFETWQLNGCLSCQPARSLVTEFLLNTMEFIMKCFINNIILSSWLVRVELEAPDDVVSCSWTLAARSSSQCKHIYLDPCFWTGPKTKRDKSRLASVTSGCPGWI